MTRGGTPSRRLQKASPTSVASTSSKRPLETPPYSQNTSKRLRLGEVEEDLEQRTPYPSTSPPPSAQPPQVHAGPEIARCEEQLQALNYILRGDNCFITGSAGCGKSALLKAAVRRLQEQEKVVYVVAPTGQAAQQVGGITLASFAGWGVSQKKMSIADIERNAAQGRSTERLQTVDVLIVDEISMVSNFDLDRLTRALQAANGNQEPFGGVQVIVCGDFCQLPPVKPFETCFNCGQNWTSTGWGAEEDDGTRIGTSRGTGRRGGGRGRQANKTFKLECSRCWIEEVETNKWAFCAQAWDAAEFTNIHLTVSHRQDQQEFMGILKQVRLGQPLDMLSKMLLLQHPHDVRNALYLYPKNDLVDNHNSQEYRKLRGQEVTYRCLDDFRWHPHHKATGAFMERAEFSEAEGGTLVYMSNHPYYIDLKLKIGTPVVLLTNLDVQNGLVNGSQGIVVGFTSPDDALFDEIEGGPSGRNATDTEKPSQYQTGGEYAHLKAEQIKRYLGKRENFHARWPIVRFNNGSELPITANCSLTQLGERPHFSLEMRTQIPLAHAWAMTIHKSQGLTLDRVSVDLSKSFGSGMAYVALSRVRHLRDLEVTAVGDSLNGGGASPQVMHFLQNTVWSVGSLC